MEECDDGNTDSLDGCSGLCEAEMDAGWAVAIGWDFWEVLDGPARMLANAILLTSETGTIDIVGLNYNADEDREMPNTNDAITSQLDALGVPYTLTVVELAGLDAALATADVAVVYEQEGGVAAGADLTAIQASLDAFTAAGGVAIALGYILDDSLVLDTERNLLNDGYAFEFLVSWTPVDGALLAQGVSGSQPPSDGQGNVRVDPAVTDAIVSATSDDDGAPIVVHRRASLCGNGVVDAGEMCDDGNFDSDDGCNVLCEAEYFCRNNSVLVVVDNPEGSPETEFLALLDAWNVDYTYATQTDAAETTSDLDTLNQYDTVIWYTHNRLISAAEQTAMETYVTHGGFLVVTGYDSLGGPTDATLAALVRSTEPGDGPFAGTATVSRDDVPATSGIGGTFAVGTVIPTGPYGNHDRAAPVDDGTISVASYGGSSKILYTPLVGDGGTIYYWNGNGLGGARAFSDWTTPGVGQQIFLNILDESCRGRAMYVGVDNYRRDAGFDRFLTNSVLNFSRRDDTVNIAAWGLGGDTEREMPNTDTAITEGAAALGRTVTIDRFFTTDVPSLEVALADAEVLLFYENEGVSRTATVATWAPTLAEFTAQGGIVVFMGWAAANTQYLDASGLMPGSTRTGGGGGGAAATIVDATHPMAAGVGSATMPNATGGVSAVGNMVSVADGYGGSVVSYVILE